MPDLNETRQRGGGVTSGDTPPGEPGRGNGGAGFGTSERGTRGTDCDADPSGESKNQGHGHPREERGTGHD